ncbi:MAG: hemP [Hydrocarboniphaga sp.]|uniref:hemin uptake protein HemP n=1 Tax=Hydrocarboniphaga sp. TaxID=2033016 RepID=UPI002611B0EB|nr:hemin uptake protein HemP [Hydrocarboniphaga sp.]MDB5971760.1 hemP [Hydrocarboniphaga sp.]
MEPTSLSATLSLQGRSPHSQRPAPQPRLKSQDLFRGTHELIIEHQGQEYRLRLTRNDKLILNK